MAAHILITGASIAGNTTAWWLTHHGFEVTVVEKAPAFREGGQNVDVRDAALDVMDLMNLRAELASHGTGETGIAFVREDNSTFAQFDVDASGGGSFTAEYEILRDDLAQLIYAPASERATYRFGDTIKDVKQTSGGVYVTFASGQEGKFDAVVVAEGVGSSTREQLFPGENDPHWMDVTIAYFTIPKAPTDSSVGRWYVAKGGISTLLRPDRQGNCRVFMMMQTRPATQLNLSVAEQKAMLTERFAKAGWEIPRLLTGMASSADFYFDVLRQARLMRWSDGRVALTGDTAWCSTPLSGMGTSLAIIGGYILAGEMAKTTDFAEAFANYEREMRPFVAKAPPAPKILPRLLHPRTTVGLKVLQGFFIIVASPTIKRLMARFGGGRRASKQLPTYRSVPQSSQ